MNKVAETSRGIPALEHGKALSTINNLLTLTELATGESERSSDSALTVAAGLLHRELGGSATYLAGGNPSIAVSLLHGTHPTDMAMLDGLCTALETAGEPSGYLGGTGVVRVTPKLPKPQAAYCRLYRDNDPGVYLLILLPDTVCVTAYTDRLLRVVATMFQKLIELPV